MVLSFCVIHINNIERYIKKSCGIFLYNCLLFDKGFYYYYILYRNINIRKNNKSISIDWSIAPEIIEGRDMGMIVECIL